MSTNRTHLCPRCTFPMTRLGAETRRPGLGNALCREEGSGAVCLRHGHRPTVTLVGGNPVPFRDFHVSNAHLWPG